LLVKLAASRNSGCWLSCVCMIGIDGRYNEGMREFANYLLFDVYEPRNQHSLQVFSLPLFNSVLIHI